ncbi:MAG: hypothetical protein ACWA40_00565 [Planktomarina sp.]
MTALTIWPALPPIKHPVSPAPLAAAFLLAPFAVALAGFWALFIPVAAVVFGYIPYVIFGTLGLLIFAGRMEITAGNCAKLGLVSYLIFAAGFAVWIFLDNPNAYRERGLFAFFFICGLIFAPLWSAVAALLYQFFTRPKEGDKT